MTEPSFDQPSKAQAPKAKHVRRSMTPIRLLKGIEGILVDGSLDDGAKISDLVSYLRELIVNEALTR